MQKFKKWKTVFIYCPHRKQNDIEDILLILKTNNNKCKEYIYPIHWEAIYGKGRAMYKLKFEISNKTALVYNIVLLKKRSILAKLVLGNEIEEDNSFWHTIIPECDLYFEIMCESQNIKDSKETISYISNEYCVFFEYFLEQIWPEHPSLFETYVNNLLECIHVLNGLHKFVNVWLIKKFSPEFMQSHSYQNLFSLLYIYCRCLTLTQRSIPLPDVKFLKSSLEAYRSNKLNLTPSFKSCIHEHVAYLAEKLYDKNVPMCLHLANILANMLAVDDIFQLIKDRCSLSVPVGNRYWVDLIICYLNSQSQEILLHILEHCPSFGALNDFKMLLVSQRSFQVKSELYYFAMKNFFSNYKMSNDNVSEFLENVLKCLQCAKSEDLDFECSITIENLIIENLLKTKYNFSSLRENLLQVVHSKVLFLTSGSNIERIVLLISQHQDFETQKMLSKVLNHEKFFNFALPESVCKAWLGKWMSNVDKTMDNPETNGLFHWISRIYDLKSLACVASCAKTMQQIDDLFDEWLQKWRLQVLFSTLSSLAIRNDWVKVIEGSLSKLIAQNKDYIKDNFNTLVPALVSKSTGLMTE